MATIMDVARLSGLSKTTVSRVINNQAYVSEEKRALVLKAMKELDYHPNPAARRLRGQSTAIIGVVVPKMKIPFFAYLVDAIEQAAHAEGYKVMICQSDGDRAKELAFLNLLKTKQVDGVIMTAMENEWKTVQSFTKHGPVVLCNEYMNEPSVPVIKMNQFEGAYLGVKHLLEKGHRKIGYCTGGLFAEEGKDKDRNRGYQKAMAEAGLSINPTWIFVDRHTIEDGKQLLKYILEMEDRPTAVFTGSDEVAAGMIAQAEQQGVNIPADVAIMGFDDEPLAAFLRPTLTTVRQPVEQMGEKATEVMINRLHDDQSDIQHYELPVEIIVRQST
ncbi:LacI family transcriptional regulator [Domibacillus sp. A3M-37]|uniref:LacI family DNA-binding transcriptional regulator n=1 Tax=Domibacillus sp. A3M-37 TaxID=2962037 RepID=UPI0020B82113|nr:LacI family DNA-binding transcriptional regulator [Domibacillus sp. A3M-37]MCP3763406.1 LacI family transcriptional regulator [Domibacillus sp. A3M-37]